MKNYISLLIFCLIPLFGISQAPKQVVDSIAIGLIDKMGQILGGMESCTLKLSTMQDQVNEQGLYERRFNTHDVYLSGPNRFAIRSRGNSGDQGYWYDGALLTWYSYDENNYVTIPSSSNIIATIDSVHTAFGVNFPGTDVLYPSLADDVLENFDMVRYVGIKTLKGMECFHIIAESETHNFQLWIENSTLYLPRKYLIMKKGPTPEIFECTYESWDSGEQLPDALFKFTPPENARLISIMPKSL
ncbi:DUF2092 domain-containing protein [Robertkochia sediminum]|uniref:DUF2092 domain-containing protein n=1 Tax=Robertkochia sediminum TaxID=2785326 RepID=UPI0019328415|nr:DUF2092 domain-containing protein [Robertkochia sediminum]MBL7471175.1 DUF2092 domain-containing protein [Robertkochia sediminum]